MDDTVTIVGAGALGLSTAYHLLRGGARDVTVLDKSFAAAGSSGRSAGIIQTQHISRTNIELRVYSREFFDGLEHQGLIEVNRCGYVRVADREEQIEELEASVELQREFGIVEPRLMDRAELVERVPWMRGGPAIAALISDHDGYIDGHLYCAALRQAIIRLGGAVVGGTRLLGADHGPAGWTLSTDRGERQTDIVVNAAGGWAAEVAEMFGSTLAVGSERHQATTVVLAPGSPTDLPCVTTYFPGSGRPGVYLRPESESTIVAGTHSLESHGTSDDPESVRQTLDDDFVTELIVGLLEWFPAIDEPRIGSGWAGVYPVTPDGLPVVGAVDDSGTVFAAAGAGGAGIMLSPVVGRVAALEILGKDVGLDCADALDPRRFENSGVRHA